MAAPSAMSATSGAPSPQIDPAERGAAVGARVAFALFVVLSVAFVLSSTWQIAAAVYLRHGDATPADSAPLRTTAPASSGRP
jgi:hypothetical protein